jgi:leucyl-tRNA synthetase
VQWTTAGVEGAWRLVNRVWSEFEAEPGEGCDAPALRRATHRLIKAVSEALDGFRFNSAIARLYEFVALLRAARPIEGDEAGQAARKEALGVMARLIGPFAPHLGEECWARLGEQGMLADAPWPDFDPDLAREEEIVLPVQIDGKRRGEVRAPAGASEAAVREIVLADPDIARRLEGVTVRRFVVVKDRIVNLVTGA